MSDGSKIEWTDATWNPTLGCQKVSEGCRNCYAIRQANRFRDVEDHPLSGLTNSATEWNGTVKLLPERLEEPRHWKKPRRVFVDSMSDLFHPDVPEDFIAQVWTTMGRCHPLHTFQILTKRPERMQDVCSRLYGGLLTGVRVLPKERLVRMAGEKGPEPFVLPNVWLGVSVEDQQAAEERIPWLIWTPAAVRFLSCEPLLGEVDLDRVQSVAPDIPISVLSPVHNALSGLNRVNWVIVGGESGPGARPMKEEWARQLRVQCRRVGVPFFLKQMGSVWAKTHGGGLKGGGIASFPSDLQVREYPEAVP